MEKRIAHISSFTFPAAQRQFRQLAEDTYGLGVSEAVHLMVLEAVRTGKIAGARRPPS